MQMRPCGASCGAHGTDDSSLCDLFSVLDLYSVHMKVHALYPAPMINHHGQAAEKMVGSQDHTPVIGGLDWGPLLAPQVYTRVGRPGLFIDHAPSTKGADYFAGDRLQKGAVPEGALGLGLPQALGHCGFLGYPL